jgi:hypothetical protein
MSRARARTLVTASTLVGALVLFPLANTPQARAEAATADPSPRSIDSLDALFTMLARSPGFFARFHEEKQIALLVAPLKNEGTIHFDRARGLARHTTSPQKQSVLLSGSTLTLWDGTKTETVPLQSSAPLRALAQSFALLLAADRAGLEKNFALSFQAPSSSQGKGQGWHLALVPLAADLKKLVTQVEVAGEGLTPKTLIVREASGDESTTTLTDVDMARHYSVREAAALFKAPPSAP